MKALIKKIKQYKYKSKSFLILGDVLSIPNDDISWVGIVSKSLKAKSVFNYSFKGATVTSKTDNAYTSENYFKEKFVKLPSENLNPDIIVVFLGLNDLINELGLLPIESTRVLDGANDFLSAYEMLLTGVRRNFPSAQIWCIGLPKVKINNKCGPDSFLQKNIGNYNKMIEVNCRVISQRKKKLKFFDLYNSISEIELNTVNGLSTENAEIIAYLILNF